MRIAILDDEQAFLEAASQRILTLLQQNFPQEASDLSVDLFATAGALLRSAESVVYDLAILDICMDGSRFARAIQRPAFSSSRGARPIFWMAIASLPMATF